MNLSIQSYTSDEAFQTLQSEWNALLDNSQRPNIFSTWEWQSSWWAAYHPGKLWILTVRDESHDAPNGQLVAIAPWFIDETHPNERLVRSIGCVDVTDYLELILRPSYETDALKLITDYVNQHTQDYDALDFCNIPHDAPFLEIWQPILEDAGFEVTIKQQEVCPIIPLGKEWIDYLNHLDKKQRHEVRRKMRKARAYQDRLAWGYIEDPAELDLALDRFFALMRTSSLEKTEFLTNAQHLDFFKQMVPIMFESGWLQISFLTIDDQDAAAYLSFDHNNRILLYNSGHNPEISPEISPGIVLLAYMIQDAIEKERNAFDFLRGDEEYKYRMGGEDFPVMTINARPSAN